MAADIQKWAFFHCWMCSTEESICYLIHLDSTDSTFEPLRMEKRDAMMMEKGYDVKLIVNSSSRKFQISEFFLFQLSTLHSLSVSGWGTLKLPALECDGKRHSRKSQNSSTFCRSWNPFQRAHNTIPLQFFAFSFYTFSDFFFQVYKGSLNVFLFVDVG